jgi:hypothetical protein
MLPTLVPLLVDLSITPLRLLRALAPCRALLVGMPPGVPLNLVPHRARTVGGMLSLSSRLVLMRALTISAAPGTILAALPRPPGAPMTLARAPGRCALSSVPCYLAGANVVRNLCRRPRVCVDREPLPDEALDPLEGLFFFPAHERDSVSRRARPSGPPDPVNVVLGVLRHIVVDDVRDPRDVDTTGRNVRRDKHTELPPLEPLKGPLALPLRPV